MGVSRGMVRVQVTAASHVIERLERLAADSGMTKSQYLTMLINHEWKEGGHTESEEGNENE